MANEYLQRTPTSTGNRRVWTWSGWLKLNSLSTSYTSIMEAFTGASDVYCTVTISSNSIVLTQDNGAGGVMIITATPLHRDPSSWFHLLVSVDTTQTLAQNRVRIYVNGDEEVVTYTTTPSINLETHFNRTGGHRIGTRWNLSGYINAEYTDVFLVDGQALTPDVFGFYKQGKGYISVGSTQATDFRPGQWVPKTPRVIKTEINRRGGFGVNGFYLPMNDSKNFGADFHCDPNSIITLNEKLPQPRVGVATTASVGLGYTDALRADPYAANLVLALPFVSGGLSSGFGDYAPSIKGSGTPNTSVLYGNTQITTVGSASSAGGYYGSCGYFDGTGDYVDTGYSVNTTFGSGNYTIECWINSWDDQNERGVFGSIANQYGISLRQFGSYAPGGNQTLSATFGQSAAGYTAGTTVRIQDQWNHVAMVKNGITGTLYLNGVAVGIATNVSAPSFTTSNLHVGAYYNSSYAFRGYIQDFRVYNTAKYKGGFDVPRPYTPVGIATWRAVPDTTANNFATLNPLIGVGVNAGDTVPALLSGNLYLDNANQTWAPATIGVSTGKWYAEFMCLNGVQSSNIGVCGDSIAFRNSQDFFNKVGVSYVRLASSSITKQFTSTSFTSGSIGYTSGDIVGVTLDVTNKEIKFFKNNVGIFTDTTLSGFTTTNTHYYFTPFRTNDGATPAGNDWSDVVTNFGQNPTFSGNTTAGTFTDSNGKGLFKYQPPSGFLALCEDNLPTPAISNPGEHFKTVLYTGDGNTGRSIVGVGFTPDLVWYKARNSAYGNGLFDSIRGALRLASDGTGAENTDQGVISFNSDGFSLGNHISGNGSGTTYVAWCWRAGAGTTSTNTNGSITSVVSVNQTAGFSIVSYNGNSTSGATVGHGLGKAPSMVIIKARDAARGWNVYHQGLGNTKYIQLSSTAAAVTNSGWWNNTSPNSSTFTLGNDNDVNGSGVGRYIAYCWAEIENFSKMGSYVGNGNADGPFVYCGFKPAVVLIKTTAGGSWVIKDSSRSPNNPNGSQLYANTSAVDDDPYGITDFLSNGFKPRVISQSVNASGETYIFAAFAESPFQTANSK